MAINKGADNNPEMQKLASEIQKLSGQLAKIESVQPGSKLGLENVRLIRDRDESRSKYQQALGQYEAVKLDEEVALRAILFQVIDVAAPPHQRSSPNRTKMVLMAVAASGFLMCLLAFILEAKRQAEQDPEQAEKIAELSKSLRKL